MEFYYRVLISQYINYHTLEQPGYVSLLVVYASDDIQLRHCHFPPVL